MRILIVDEDPWVGQALRLVLRQYDVIAIQDASAALRRIREGERFDAILCDVGMPNRGSAALYDALAAEAPFQAERMLFMTAGATSKEAVDFIHRQRGRVLIKPFQPADLLFEIGALLAKHAAKE